MESQELAAKLGEGHYELTFSGLQDTVIARDDQTSWHIAAVASELNSYYPEKAMLLVHESNMMLR
jgi:hypothetical protein